MNRIFDLDLRRFVPSFVGRIDELERMFDELNTDASGSFPHHDIVKYKNNDQQLETYEIIIALAGFKKEELDIKLKGNNLTIAGSNKDADNEQVEYIYNGIAKRSFKKTFTLSQYVNVEGASMENGLLRIKLVKHVPEEMRLKEIKVS